jgi:hypothetical protein
MTDLPTESDQVALSSGMFEPAIRALDVAYNEWTVGSGQIGVSSALADMFRFDPDTWTVVVKQHGGQLTVGSPPGVFTEFVVTLPRTPAASDGART